jgi:hypothetical protein
MPSYMEKNHDPLQVVGLGANRISTGKTLSVRELHQVLGIGQ